MVKTMSNNWTSTLAAMNVEFEALGNLDTAGKAVLTDLSPLAVVDITGEDATDFLQAQVCNDLQALAANEGQINGYCSPKGRLLALFLVYKMDGGFRLVLPSSVVAAFVKRLQMYVLRAKVTVVLNEDLGCSGLVHATASLEDAHWPSLPDNILTFSDNSQVGDTQTQIIRWHDHISNNGQSLPRYILIAKPDTLKTMWQDHQYVFAPFEYWRLGDISAGIPSVVDASTDQFIPQMVNLQLINALSFKKGCYPGQEIVARMQYLGKLKKHMQRFVLPSLTTAPTAGTVITTESNNNAGQIVDAVTDGTQTYALAVVNKGLVTADLRIGDATFLDAALPYSLNAETDSDAESAG
jgi:folate-binding protein YgfZ